MVRTQEFLAHNGHRFSLQINRYREVGLVGRPLSVTGNNLAIKALDTPLHFSCVGGTGYSVAADVPEISGLAN